MARDNTSGLVHLFLHLSAIVGIGYLLYLSMFSWICLPLLVLQGVLVAFLFAPMHECVHSSAFKTRRLNVAVGRFAGLMILRPFLYLKYRHMAHHTFTQHPQADPDRVPFPRTLLEYLLHVSSYNIWHRMLRNLYSLSLARFSDEERKFIPQSELSSVVAELQARKALTADSARAQAVQKRHKLGKQTARENVEQLVDKDSFVEYGDLVYAAQRVRRSADDLMRNTPADGLVTGFATVNGDLFGPVASRTAVMAYDYTVLAGTQGIMNHTKKDRMVSVIERQLTPIVFFCEGGGGRPGDVDAADTSVAGLYYTTFYHYARLSGLVPMVGIASGRLFAGNAALLG